MVPIPQEPSTQKILNENKKSDERVVISGMSGLFPDSHHVKDLADILYSKKNPISPSPRWTYNHPEVSQYVGKVPDLDSFDAQFFKVHYLLGNSMDVMGRKILEQAYQAIYDAGVSPSQLYGKNVGVYIGSCFSECEKACFYVAESRTGFGVAGCNKSMFANRISYWLNAKGPSVSIDEACCSSTAALEQAYLAINRGECEAAIVGGANVCLHPQSSVHYGRIMSISMDGKTRSFDKNASGCAKSEAINVLFLQKAKDALRIYGDIIHVKSQFTSLLESTCGPKFGFYRDPRILVEFLKNFYEEAKVLPKSVEYVEAFGSAVSEADKAELESLDAVFCKNRNKELLVGSVMSNIGYGEAASGISAVTKVLLGYHYGALAANLNCDNQRQDIAALRDGRMRIVTENQPFGRTYTAVNGMAITGVNAHVLLHGHYKPKELSRYKSNIPYLVTISARQDFSVKNILTDLKSRPIDAEELALLHNIHQAKTWGHMGRGFIILDTNQQQETVSLCEKADYFDDTHRPLWFVYSGMGSQWAGMGAKLMRIPIFSSAIERCHKVLAPKGLDVINIITSTDKGTFDNILNSFVGIAAIQIGLTDILRELDLVPDHIIGHSVGELGCAYADGCLTAEEMILAAYYRGLVSIQTPFIRGSMAAVGIGYKQILTICPSEIDVACHNGPESCTISGPADLMKKFVAELTDKKIFAKEVQCSNIAYHSRYIANAGPMLLKYLKEIIKLPRKRSARWLSTSIPQEKWDEPSAKLSSAEYYTNNLLNSVLFEETSQLIPPNAVLVEIAPHGLLQAILKRSLPDSCRHVSLTRRGHPDNVQYLLEAIGNLYMEGYNPKVQKIYPKIEFPVSTGTPFLSHLVEWAHSEKWAMPVFVSAHRKMAASCKLIYSIHDIENKYLTGNILRGKNMFPFAAVLVAAWDVLAMSTGVLKKHLSVQFHDLKFFSQPTLHDQRQLRLFISIQRASGYFEVTDNQIMVASGYIQSDLVNATELNTDISLAQEIDLKSIDIYTLFYKRGYDYKNDFRSIQCANKSLTEAQIYWRNNWVTFIDGMMQLSALRQPYDSVIVPTHIRKITIDLGKQHNSQKISIYNEKVMRAQISETHNLIRCGGVVIEDIKFRKLPACNSNTNLMDLKFVPYVKDTDMDIPSILFVYLQIVAENLNKECINILEVSDNMENVTYFKNIFESCIRVPSIEVNYNILQREMIMKGQTNNLSDVDLLIVSNLSNDDKLCRALYRILRNNTYLLNKETYGESLVKKPSTICSVVSAQCIGSQLLELVRWKPISSATVTSSFILRSSTDLTLLSSTLAKLPKQHKLIIVTSYPPIDGLRNFIQKWRKDHSEIYVIMFPKTTKNKLLDELPHLHSTFSIFCNGQWGGEFFVPFRSKVCEACDIKLHCSRIGSLDSLHWIQLTDLYSPGVDVTVHYAGINDMDVQRCTGVMSPNETQNDFGMDFSGVTKSGNRVMGLVNSGAVSSRVIVQPEFLWPVPEYWTLEDAATVPFAYCFAYYCLCIKHKLYPGMSILVHGGAGALGQAVISIALRYGCKVFTTVSDVRKKKFLCELFPELQGDQIGNSRDHSFGDMVLQATDGEGCDVVISCIKEDRKNISLKCTGRLGVMFDIEHLFTQRNFYYGMDYQAKERSYYIVNFLDVFKESNDNIKMLQLLLSEGIKCGYVRPLSRVVYPPNEISSAFRLLAGYRNRGRVLIQLQDSTKNKLALLSDSRLHCDSDLSHLILCNGNNFGLGIAEILVKHGARKVFLQGLKQSAYIDFEIRSLKKLGVEVKFSDNALESKKDVYSLVHDCINLSQVEGVYVVRLDGQGLSEPFDMLQELDLTTRKLCPYLKYFGVVSNIDQDFQAYISRAQNKLPMTLLKLPKLKKKCNTEPVSHTETFDERDVLNSFELALHSKETVLSTMVLSDDCRSLMHEIAIAAGLKLPNVIKDSDTLTDLKLQFEKSPIICTLLRDNYNICMPEEDIPNLTIEKIQEIQNSIKDPGFNNTKGLKTFYSYVDSDELLATTEMVFMPTQVQSYTMRDDELDVTQTYLCIIPGLEGHYERFRILCERLKVPAVVLQPGLDRPDETISNLAHRYVESLLKKSLLQKNFYLMGYESGTLVALEMAAILEDKGLTGTIFCVGESPDKFHITLQKELKEYDSEEELQIATSLHMCNLMVDETSGLEKELRKMKTWPERVKKCTNFILGRVSHSAQYAQEVINCAYKRIKQVQAYELPPLVLRSKLILITAESSAASFDNSIQLYSRQSVDIYQLRAPLAQSAEDLRCTAIINSQLSTDLLRAFEKKNICDTYLLNADCFMEKTK